MTHLTATARLQRKSALAVVATDGRVALVDLDRLGVPPRILEGPAGAIWEAVDGHRTTDEICAVVAEEYGVPPALVSEDVAAFLAELVAVGLLVEASS